MAHNWTYEPAHIVDEATGEKHTVHNPGDAYYYDHLFMIGNEYGVLCVVFAQNGQAALDYAADEELLKGLSLDRETVQEREQHDGDGIMYLGNADEPYDSTYAWICEISTK